MSETDRAGDEPVAFIDIGATLVGADVKGPASRIGALLGFDRGRRRALRKALMTTEFHGPEEVAGAPGRLAARRRPRGRRSAVASGRIWEAQEGDARPLTGAPEALARFAAEGWRLGLISNIWQAVPRFRPAPLRGAL